MTFRTARCFSHTALAFAANLDIDRAPERIYVDKGYVRHDVPKHLRVFRSGQKRGVHGQIKRELKRRSAVEPIIGHIKAEHRMDHNYLKGRQGDRINAVLAAAGYNFKRIAKWLRDLLLKILTAIAANSNPKCA